MGALTDLWKSERGLIAVSLIIAATVLSALTVLTPERWEQWSTFVKWIFITYTAGKTITGGISIFKGANEDAPAQPAAPAAPPAPAPATENKP